MTRYTNIIRLLTVALSLLCFAVSTTAGTTIVYAGETTELSVVEVQGDSYSWELYDDVTGINLATTAGNCPLTSAYFPEGNTGATVKVKWLVPGKYFFKVTAVNDCPSNNIKVGIIEVLPSRTYAEIEPPGDICQGETTDLVINLYGMGPWSFDITDGTNTITHENITDSQYRIPVSPDVTTPYTITRVTDTITTNLDASNTATLVVFPRPVTSPIRRINITKN